MENLFCVQEGGESLTARLLPGADPQIELTYVNPEGDLQVGIYWKKNEISTRATLANGANPYDRDGNTCLSGYLVAYERLGPKLREKVPSDWHAILGRWLTPKEE